MGELHNLKRWLSMLRRTAEADPAANDVLTYQGNNQVEWSENLVVGGSLGIGAAPGSASEILSLTSTTAGFVLPRMTTVERNAIVAPVNGMMVYDTTVGAIYGYEGGAWVNI